MPYERGKMTVMCNETGTKLIVPQIPTSDGRGLILGLDEDKQGMSIDLETVARPTELKYAGIDDLERRGLISMHPKPSGPDHVMPKGKKKYELSASGGAAPANHFDEKLNEVIEKEEREDERTKVKNRKRNLKRETPATA